MSRVAVLAVVTLMLGVCGTAPAAAAETKPIQIAAGPAGQALKQFVAQTGLQLLFDYDAVNRLTTKPVSGRLEAADALKQMLAGTGLAFEFVNDRTVTVTLPGADKQKIRGSAVTRAPDGVRLTQVAGGANSAAESPDQETEGARNTEGKDPRQPGDRQTTNPRGDAEPNGAGEIVVTGTHIRGGQPASPVVTITQDEMRLSGHNNLGEVIRALPQNFGGGQNPTVVAGAQNGTGNNNNTNITGSSALNLRGLGADATVTLLNGARLPYDGSSQATDVSVIPVAAIERMEVLLDGASAIYGSDAVGGVANIILKRNYDGLELSARYGKATDGGYGQQQYTAVGGTTWNGGGFILTADLLRADPVLAGERAYLAAASSPRATVYPRFDQDGGLLSLHQALGSAVEFAVDGFYTDREDRDYLATPAVSFDATRGAKVWGASPSVRVDLPRQFQLRLRGFVGEDAADIAQATRTTSTNVQTALTLLGTHNKTQSADLGMDGPAFSLPAGELRLSAGGGYRRNEYLQRASSITTGEDSSRYLYTEVNAPLASEAQGIPLVRDLTFSAAVRYEDYESFGDTTTPKIGLNWNVVSGLDLKASWGKSFKVPTLSQQFGARTVVLYPNTFVAGVPAGRTILADFGGNPGLTPERAEVLTLGFVAEPAAIPGLGLEFSWFDIDYTDRVIQPINPLAQALSPGFAEFVITNPTVADQNAVFEAAGRAIGSVNNNFTTGAYDPAAVYVVVHNFNTNASVQKLHGADLMLRYAMDAFGGRLLLNAAANRISSSRRITPLTPELRVSGLLYYPAEFRARAGVAWSRNTFTVASTFNHIGAVTDTNVTPRVKTGSMTTIDLVIDCLMRMPVLGDLGLNVVAVNIADTHPPYSHPPAAQPYLFGYDSTNYSALGRVLNVTLTKQF